MNLDEAIKILQEHQNWRTGTEIPQQDPFMLSQAINIILDHLKKTK